jgi:hypothetical protein
VDAESVKFILLTLWIFSGAAQADEQEGVLNDTSLEGRSALTAIYGRKVVFHESIGNVVAWLFLPNRFVTVEVNGKKFEGRMSDANNGIICTTYLTLNNIVVCHKYVLRDNKLTKIDVASQIGNESEIIVP